MIKFLWRNRERPVLFSRRWLIVWVKRVLNSYGLIRILKRRWPHLKRGVRVGELSIIYGLEVNGSGKNLSVGDHSFIGRNVHIATHEKVMIGSFVCVNNDVRMLSASHDLSDPRWRMYARPIVVGDYAWIATGATILPGVTIGRGAVVGAGAVVARDVPDYAVALGNPAQIRLNRRSKELNYDPVIFTAPYEAWIGRNASLKAPDGVAS